MGTHGATGNVISRSQQLHSTLFMHGWFLVMCGLQIRDLQSVIPALDAEGARRALEGCNWR